MNNKGSAYASLVLFWMVILLVLLFLGVAIFEIIITGQLHEIKNDMYLINRNVLMALQRDTMGEDVSAVYSKNVKRLVEEEIGRQWNIDVSTVLESGRFVTVNVDEVNVISTENDIYIESVLDIKLRPVIFQNILKDKLSFLARGKIKIKKMKGWDDE